MSTTVTNRTELQNAFAAPPGDNLIIVDSSNLDGSGLTIPAGITLRGATVGTSEIQIGLTGGDPSPADFMTTSANVTVDGLRFTCPLSGTNEDGLNTAIQGEYGDYLLSIEGADVTLQHCVFSARTGQLVQCQPSGRNVTVYHCRFQGGFDGFKFNAANTNGHLDNNPKFTWCWIEYAEEGIKMVSGGPYAKRWSDNTKTPDIHNCYFLDCGRDGVDLTKGWRNLWIKDCLMWDSSIDFKANWDATHTGGGVYTDQEEDYPDGGNYTQGGQEPTVAKRVPWDIRVEDTHFVTAGFIAQFACGQETSGPTADDYHMTSAVVNTAPLTDEYDSGLEAESEWIYYGPRNMEFRNCTIELPPGSNPALEDTRVFLAKAGKGFIMTNTTYRNDYDNANTFVVLTGAADGRTYGYQEDGQTNFLKGNIPLDPVDLTGYDFGLVETGTTYDAPATPGLAFPAYIQTDDPAAVKKPILGTGSGNFFRLGGTPLIL